MIKCPRCGFQSLELIECEICKIIGCTKCIIKHKKQWICEKCKSSPSLTTPENALSSMFG